MGGGKRAHNVRVIGRVQVEDGLAADGSKPLAANQIVKRGIRHGNLEGQGTGIREQVSEILQFPDQEILCYKPRV
jgi:hypothetical protein